MLASKPILYVSSRNDAEFLEQSSKGQEDGWGGGWGHMCDVGTLREVGILVLYDTVSLF